MDRRQIASLLVLKELGLEPKMKSFEDRLIMQKAIYLAQEKGLDMSYSYGWYLRGPYCSAVAQDLFAAIEDPAGMKDACTNWSLDDKTKKRLHALRHVIASAPVKSRSSDDRKGSTAKHLELLASVHYLVKRGQVKNRTPQGIRKKLEDCNKKFAEPEVAGALTNLKNIDLL